MEVIRGKGAIDRLERPYVAIGSFDGVHVGHQAIIGEMVRQSKASGAPAVVLTFEPHPAIALQGHGAPPLLTTFEAKKELLRHLGVDVLWVLSFDKELASLEPGEFAGSVLASGGAAKVFVGYNFSFGRGGKGDAGALERLGEMYGFEVQVFGPVRQDGEAVSSTRVRECLLMGDVERACRMLGRPYRLQGVIQEGAGRGRELGYPTANLECPPFLCIPQTGVYASYATVLGRRHPAVTNVGYRPTFGDNQLAIEVHMLDYAGSIYGETLGVDFIKRLRREVAFSSVEQLLAQIAADVVEARAILSE